MLGSAGCGFEYSNQSFKCSYLTKELFGFKCLKYQVDLKIHDRSQHPIRYKGCVADADAAVCSKIQIEKTVVGIRTKRYGTNN